MKNSLGNVVIFGDSYSAHADFIPPGHNPCYNLGEEREWYRLDKSEMWWHKLTELVDANIILNASAAGSAISYSGWYGYDPNYSFIGRFESFQREGFFEENKVDSLILFGGTNDYWIPAPLGEYKNENITEEDKKCVLPAICYLFGKIKSILPNTRVLVLENDCIKGPIIETLDSEAAKYGFEVIKLKGISKIDDHPDRPGMIKIAEQIYEYIKEN